MIVQPDSSSLKKQGFVGGSFEFSDGFTELHTQSYQGILAGNGFKLMEAKTAIDIVHDIRTQTPIGAKGDYHPYVNLPLNKHPFAI